MEMQVIAFKMFLIFLIIKRLDTNSPDLSCISALKPVIARKLTKNRMK